MARRTINKKDLIKAVNEGRKLSDTKKYEEVQLQMMNRRR